MSYIEIQHSYKRYRMGDTVIEANRDVNFFIEKGELAIILGSSGAGKSTVLNILGGMDTNDEGKVIIDGKDISGYSQNELITYRRNDVGFVFQFYNLIQNLTAKENVELASEIVKDALDPVQVLKDVGLAKRIDNFPARFRRMAFRQGLRSCKRNLSRRPITSRIMTPLLMRSSGSVIRRKSPRSTATTGKIP